MVGKMIKFAQFDVWSLINGRLQILEDTIYTLKWSICPFWSKYKNSIDRICPVWCIYCAFWRLAHLKIVNLPILVYRNSIDRICPVWCMESLWREYCAGVCFESTLSCGKIHCNALAAIKAGFEWIFRCDKIYCKRPRFWKHFQLWQNSLQCSSGHSS